MEFLSAYTKFSSFCAHGIGHHRYSVDIWILTQLLGFKLGSLDLCSKCSYPLSHLPNLILDFSSLLVTHLLVLDWDSVNSVNSTSCHNVNRLDTPATTQSH